MARTLTHLEGRWRSHSGNGTVVFSHSPPDSRVIRGNAMGFDCSYLDGHSRTLKRVEMFVWLIDVR